MKLKEIFSLHMVRQKIVITSKLAGAVLIISYIFSTHVSDNHDISFLIWLAFMIPLILGIDFLMGRFISDPVSELNDAAGRMAKLDFSQPCTVSSKDEFGELSDSLNQMSENLQRALAQLETANTQLAADIEDKQRLLAERKELTDNLSHEMKTPVGVIRAYAEGIQDEADEAKRQKYAGIIITETERMSELITALLDLSALESGASSLDFEVFDFVELVEIAAGRLLGDTADVYTQSDEICPLRNDADYGTPFGSFHLEYELPEHKIYVNSDRKRMEQVLDNLIVNARNNVCPGGRLKLSVRNLAADSLSACSDAKEQEQVVHFSIFNEGKNIPEESLSRIWTKFFRDQKAGYHGSGLGLSIVAQILSMQNLDYGVENMPDGVLFYFSMPVYKGSLD